MVADPNFLPILQLAFALFLVLLNGWFVLAEFALVRVRPTRLKEIVGQGLGNKGAERALAITLNLDPYLSAAQLGITLASLGLGWIGEPAIASLIKPAVEMLPLSATVIHGFAVVLAFIAITFLHMVFGETAPKLVAVHRAEGFAVAVARPLHAFYMVTYPLITVLQRSSEWFVRLTGVRAEAPAPEAHTEEELRLIVAASHKQGVLDEATRDLLDNVFEYTERIAREIVTAKRQVVVLNGTEAVGTSLEDAIEKEYTRYPLIDPESDRVLGFVHIKDLMAIAMGKRRVTSLVEIARQPVFVPETVAIDRVRRQLQAKKTHFGIVVDEFGDFTGIVTLEDLLEELVGEIQDELDSEAPKILRRADGTIEVDGGLLLETAIKKLGLRLTEEVEGVDTIGGYVFTLIGRAPVTGDQVQVGDHRIDVLQVDELRIRRVKIVRSERPAQSSEPIETFAD